MGLQDSYDIFVLPVMNLAAWVSPTARHFVISWSSPPILSISPGLSPFDTAVIGNRSAVCELKLKKSLKPFWQSGSENDMDALSVIDNQKKSLMLFIVRHCLAEGG